MARSSCGDSNARSTLTARCHPANATAAPTTPYAHTCSASRSEPFTPGVKPAEDRSWELPHVARTREKLPTRPAEPRGNEPSVMGLPDLCVASQSGG
jgi:hypothetical protein